MKKLLFLFSILSPLLFISNCKNEKKILPPQLKTLPAFPAPLAPVDRSVYFGSYFQPTNPSLYKTLLESCRRCGLKRLVNGQYTRYYTFDKGDPKRCENWNGRGFLQVKFAEKRLPTDVTVSILPLYVHRNNRPFAPPGVAIELQGRAEAINKNRGFQILLQPVATGLTGIYHLEIRSDHDNIVTDTNMEVIVNYGSSDSPELAIIDEFRELQGNNVTASSQGCHSYTN